METAIVSLVCVAILLIGTVTTVMTSFNAAGKVADSLREWEKQSTLVRATDITLTPPSNYNGGTIELWINNTGSIGLADFGKWDLIAQWQSSKVDQVGYLSNVSGAPGANQWSVSGIYMADGSGEEMEPGILNVGEKMRVLISLSPAMDRNDICMITVSCVSGVTAECMFQRK